MPVDLFTPTIALLGVVVLAGLGLEAWYRRRLRWRRQCALMDVLVLWRAGRLTADDAVQSLITTRQHMRALQIVDPLYAMPPDVFMRVLHRRLGHCQRFPASRPSSIQRTKTQPVRCMPAVD